jgi:arylsulfatase A-like enzyme
VRAVASQTYALVFFIFLFVSFTSLAAEAPKTNLIFILSDNHGAWTLGCYGNKEIRTPNIDRLAAEGTLFTRAFCANPVCSPSRATFLTGLMPSQHGVHSYLGADTAKSPSGPKRASSTSSELAENSVARGYTCGLAGKWHLGGSLQPQEGFGYWFTKPSGHTTAFYGDDAIWQGKIYKETNYMTEVIANHAVEFLEQNRAKPFFLYLTFNAPYGLGAAVQHPHTNRHTAYYADKNMDSFPRAKVNPALKTQRVSVNNLESMRSYAAAVSGLDDGIGRVMDTLRRLNLETNTLVVFAADQGLSGGHGGYWGIGDHSRPVNVRDEVMRIPLIFRMPGKISAGKKSDLMVSNYDFLPTALELLGQSASLPTRLHCPAKVSPTHSPAKPSPGATPSFTNTKTLASSAPPTGNSSCAPSKDRTNSTTFQHDPDELHNLIANAAHTTEKERLEKRLKEFFAKYADAKYDLWNGGVSKARRVVAAE